MVVIIYFELVLFHIDFMFDCVKELTVYRPPNISILF